MRTSMGKALLSIEVSLKKAIDFSYGVLVLL